MGERSAIEWTDHTFNPWIGCTRISPGCDRCYAAQSTPVRILRARGFETWGTEGARRRSYTWGDPPRWNKRHETFAAQHGRRQRVFCASLADVFDNEVPDEWRVDLFKMIAATPDLDWLLVTKRIGNVARMLGDYQTVPLLPNIWLGITVVNQEEADRDVQKLLRVPARVRFLSVEPMLGPISLTNIQVGGGHGHHEFDPIVTGNALKRADPAAPSLRWVICGGESGPKARPMRAAWAQSLRDQCDAAGVPFLFKQWGEWAEVDGDKPTRTFQVESDIGETLASRCDGFISQAGEFVRSMDDATTDDPYRGMQRVGKKAAGRLLDGVVGVARRDAAGVRHRARRERSAAVARPVGRDVRRRKPVAAAPSAPLGTTDHLAGRRALHRLTDALRGVLGELEVVVGALVVGVLAELGKRLLAEEFSGRAQRHHGVTDERGRVATEQTAHELDLGRLERAEVVGVLALQHNPQQRLSA